MHNGENPLLLIVDDTPSNLQVAGEILSRQNYRIALAQSGNDAIAFLKSRKPDLILLDIMMPDVDGFRVCEYLKENIETRFIPVIFLTARAQIEDIVKGFEIGGADYLTKPFNEKELIARVKSQLELVKLQDMLRSKNRKLLDEIRLRKQRERDLVDYEKGRHINVLVGGIAHEFNNLLQVILGYGELIESNMPEDSEEKQLQGEVLKAGRKAARMVEQLMLFADRKPGKNLEKIDLVKFIKNRTSLFRGIFSEDIEFDFKLPNRPLFILADHTELTQIFINLLLNANGALKSEGKITVKIDLYNSDNEFLQKYKVAFDSSFAMIEIADNGVGMSENQVQKVFDPFVTYQQGNGIGLGLSVVKAIVKRLNGIIDLRSNQNDGTVCRIYLPDASEEANTSPYFKPSEKLSPEPIGKGETILLAEDEETVLSLERRILEKEGFKIIEARDGNQALDYFSKNLDSISLVLVDIGLPGKSGIEVGKEIHKISLNTPVVYCTAYSDKGFEDIADNGLILQKPFKRNEIVSLIKEALPE
ncbi:MAG: ATP-binding response regulator [Candidatus Rifleibacteriota bacterium]